MIIYIERRFSYELGDRYCLRLEEIYRLIVAMSLIVQGAMIAEMHIVELFMRLLTESPLTRRLCVSYILSNMTLTTHK